jgi:hypothetical protein
MGLLVFSPRIFRACNDLEGAALTISTVKSYHPALWKLFYKKEEPIVTIKLNGSERMR